MDKSHSVGHIAKHIILNSYDVVDENKFIKTLIDIIDKNLIFHHLKIKNYSGEGEQLLLTAPK